MQRKDNEFRWSYWLIPVLLGALGFFSPTASSDSNYPAEPPYPVLILDFKENPKLPIHFRMASTPCCPKSSMPTPSLSGLETLQASGSSQFSKENFFALLKHISHPKVMIVDLRKESHGFVDGLPISWFGYHNMENKNITPREVIALEKKLINSLNHSTSLHSKKMINTFIKEEKGNKSFFISHPLPFTRSAQTEQQFVMRAGYRYIRFYVVDYSAPDDSQIERFVQFVKTLPNNTWLHFHCHDGHGRTTTFLAMYDMIRNSKKVSFEDIIKRHFLLGGADLQKTMENTLWRDTLYKQRLAVLKQFYAYTLDPKGYQQSSWMAWKRKQLQREL